MSPTLETLVPSIDSVLRRYGVVKAGVFGSFARGESHDASDLDLVVEFEEGRSLLDLVALQQELGDVLGMEVDVTTYRALHPLLRDRILAEEQHVL